MERTAAITSPGRIRGLQKLPKPNGYSTWYWTASQISRLSAGFYPRTVRLWHGIGEPTAAEYAAIENRAAQLSLDLQDWLVQPDRKTRSRRGQIYFIRAGENIKIGFSKDIKQRMSQLQTFFPFPLELLAALSGSALTERQIHHRFRHLRSTGEWFRRAPEIDAFLEKNIVRTARQNRNSKRQNRGEKA